jgi:hypothetical protein
MMFGYVYSRNLMVRTTLLHVVDNVEGLQAMSCRTSSQRWMTPTRHMDESGQGPKRVVDEAVAHLLKIHPGIHNTEDFSSKRPVLR